MLWFDRHRRFRARLSGYIDAQLSPKEARAVDTHLEGCDACRQEVGELRATVMVMRDLAPTDIPRSFTLSPEQVARSIPLPLPSTPPLAIGMRLAGAALAFSLAAVMVADFGDFSGSGGGGDLAATQESGNDDALRSSLEADGAQAPTAGDVPVEEPNDASKTLGAAETRCSPVTHNNGPFGTAGDAAATSVPDAIAESTPASASGALPEESNCLADGTGAYFAASPTLDAIAELPGPIEEDLQPGGSFDAKGNLSILRWLEIALAVALGVVLAGLAGAVTAPRRR
jgi:hypothetical protein